MEHDTHWTALYSNGASFVSYRRIGSTCWLHWYFGSCGGEVWRLPAALPEGCRPKAAFSGAGCIQNNKNDVAKVYVYSDGEMDFWDAGNPDENDTSEGMVSFPVGL